MEILYLGLKDSGVRFLTKLSSDLREQVSENNFKYYFKKEDFLKRILEREEQNDILIVTAHGAKYSIIRMDNSSGNYYPYLKANDFKNINHDLIICIACLTAQGLGKELVQRGAEAFIGYDVLISPLFTLEQDDSLEFGLSTTDLESILKRIYKNAFYNSFLYFLFHCKTIKDFKNYLCYLYDAELNSLLRMSSNEILTNYGVNVSQEAWKKYKKKLFFNDFVRINKLQYSMVICGDSKYRSTFALENFLCIDEEDIMELKSSDFDNPQYKKIFDKYLNTYISWYQQQKESAAAVNI